MIRLRITQDDTRAPGPRAVLVAYRDERITDADDPRIPAFLRDATRDPDAISRAAPHVDALDEPEDTPEPDTEDTAPGGSEPEPSAAGDNTWAGTVIISVTHALPGFSGVPFCYEYLQPGRANRASVPAELPDPVLRIVAAPGVNIYLLPPRAGQPLVRVDILRVQDPRTVPTLGDSINASLILLGNDVGMHRYSLGMTGAMYATMMGARMTPGDDAPDSDPDDDSTELANEAAHLKRIAVIPQRNGILFFDNLSERMLQISVPRFSTLTLSSRDDQARFGYVIHQNAAEDEVAVTIAATANVQVAQFHYSSFDAGLTLTPDLQDDQIAMQPFALLRVPEINTVPAPGMPINPPSAPPTVPTMRDTGVRFRPWVSAEIPMIETPPTLAEIAAHIMIDVMISRIEPVGDALDIMELGYALVSGRDRWGQRAGLTDLAMMAMGAVMPFVGRRDLQLALFLGQAGGGVATITLDDDTEPLLP